jgi:tetratricopeptide (TPR) repeat protein
MKKLLLLTLLAGCAHTTASKPVGTRIEMEPLHFEAHDGKVEIADPAALFERAGAQFNEKDFAGAANSYDELVRKYPDSRFVVPSLYNAALSLENAGDFDAASERYRTLIARGTPPTDVLDAQFRLGALHASRNNWAAAAQVYVDILDRKDLTASDRVEAMARRGVAQFNLKDLVAAERTLREQQALVKKIGDSERLDTDYFVAEAAYYLAEVTHEQYRLLPVRLPEKRMYEDLEAKARMLKLAQVRYLDCMRVNNAEWTTAAGYQFALLYRELYDDLVGAPVPSQLNGEAREVYLEEVKKKVRPLLEHAIHFHERNVMAGQFAGLSQGDWVRKSNEQLEQLRRLLLPGAAPADAPPPPEAPKPPLPPPLPRGRDDIRPQQVL